MNEQFEKACKEAGIPYEEFPYDFPVGGKIDYASIVGAMMWILTRRQDKIGKGYTVAMRP